MAVNKKATGVAIAAGVLTLGAGVGIAGLAQAEPSPSPSSPSGSASATPGTGADRGKDGRGGRGFIGGESAAQLAEKLGVTEAKLTEALRAIHEERRANRPSTAPSTDPSASPSERPDRAERDAELAKALAEKLGLAEDKVATALTELREAHQAERAAALKERLDAAVQ
ncbi:MAG TPA: hypothetical protein VIT42_01920, partial [Microlunatus sp.]